MIYKFGRMDSALAVACLASFHMGITMVQTLIQPKIVYITDQSLDLYEDHKNIDVSNLNTSINLTVETLNINHLNLFTLHKTLCHLTSNGTIAFITYVSCEHLYVIKSVAHNLKVPLVDIGGSNTKCEDFTQEFLFHPHTGNVSESIPQVSNSTNVFHYEPLKTEFSSILSDVLFLLEWEDVIVVYDDASGNYLNEINSVLIEQNVTGQSFKINDLEIDIDYILQYVNGQSGQVSTFIIACSKTCMEELMFQANEFDKVYDVQGLFTYHSQFLLIPHSRNDLTSLRTHVQQLDHVSAITSADFNTDTSRKQLQEIIQLVVTALTRYSGDLNSLQKIQTTTCGYKYAITDYVITSFQDFFSDDPCTNCTEYVVTSAFYLSGNERSFQVVGEWTREEYLMHDRIFPNMAFGFNGRYFKTVTNIWDPFVIVSTNSSTGFEGLCMALLDELAWNMNFTYNLSVPRDGEWGTFYNATGKWSGLVGVMEDKTADLVVAPLGSNVNREKVMDFTEAFFLEYQAVLVRYKNSEAEKWRLYLEPFQWQTWLCFVGAIPLGAFTIWLVTVLTPYYKCHGPESEKKAKQGLGRIENALFFSFGSFFQQGSIWMPDSQSGRFIVGFWWMYCIVVMATYSGNLIAYLTVTKTTLPFDTLEDMINQNKFKFGTLGGTLTHYKLENARDGVDKALWDKITTFKHEDPSVLGKSHDAHIRKTLDENYAYIQDRTSFEIETSKRCDIGIMSELFQPMEYSLGLQNNSYFEKIFSLEIIKIRETGLLNKWKVEWWPRKSFCSTGTQTIAKKVSLIDVQGAYYVMGILLAAALISLVVEAFINFVNPKLRDKHSGHSHMNGKENLNGSAKNQQNGVIKNQSLVGFDTLQSSVRVEEYGGNDRFSSNYDYQYEYGGMFDSYYNYSKYNP